MRKFVKLIVLLVGAGTLTGAGTPRTTPEGHWLTENKAGIIDIFRCGDTLCGRLAWFRIDPKDPNPQALDLKNPDPARRTQPLCGLVFLHGFKPADDDSWDDGMVYDPESGKTYHATMKLEQDGALRLRGYIGIPLLGRSEVWTRYSQPVPTCPSR